jgi:toxin-antitoxin system PIN domain toxin
VIAIDTNLLVYAHREDMPFHAKAAACLRDVLNSGQPCAIPWPCVHEFLAITTNPRIFKTPTPMALALKAVESWQRAPSLQFLAEQDGHLQSLRELLLAGLVAGPLVHDARIAALCLQHGVRELWSADRDFGRFAALKVVNPLVAG